MLNWKSSTHFLIAFFTAIISVFLWCGGVFSMNPNEANVVVALVSWFAVVAINSAVVAFFAST